MGKSYMNLGDYVRALDCYEKALKIDPGDKFVISERDKSKDAIFIEKKYQKATKEKDYKSAKQYLQAMLNYSPKSKKYHVENYKLTVDNGYYDEAQAILMNLKGICSNADLHCLKARMKYMKGEMENTLSILNNILRYDPDHKESQILLKNTKRLLKFKEEANSLFKEGKYNEAQVKYGECLLAGDGCKGFMAIIYTNRATAFLKQEKYEQALEDLNKAILCNYNYPQAFHKRGEVNLKLKNFNDAIRDMERAQELDPKKFDLNDRIKQTKIDSKRAQKKDYYAVLKVPMKATDAEIKKSYRKLAIIWHPDRAHDPKAKEESERMFKEITEAYHVLISKEKRLNYDLELNTDDSNFGSFQDNFNLFDVLNNYFTKKRTPGFTFGSKGNQPDNRPFDSGSFPGFAPFKNSENDDNFSFKFG